jgi:hypothetical protein
MRQQGRLLSVLGRVRHAAAGQIDEQAINGACTEEDDHWHERLLNHTNTIQARSWNRSPAE